MRLFAFRIIRIGESEKRQYKLWIKNYGRLKKLVRLLVCVDFGFDWKNLIFAVFRWLAASKRREIIAQKTKQELNRNK